LPFGHEKAVINIKSPDALFQFYNSFTRIFKLTYTFDYSNIILLCIGTDRSTGDCLGPLVGYKLKALNTNDVFIYGTLQNPVHAKNLKDVLEEINTSYKKPFIIAVDACLGGLDRIGSIVIDAGPLTPGAGVNKRLPKVGHMHIVGIVNVGGFAEYLVLQNTRLSLVMEMADAISTGIYVGLRKMIGNCLSH
jgi:putative sporulation protein YyaC